MLNLAGGIISLPNRFWLPGVVCHFRLNQTNAIGVFHFVALLIWLCSGPG